MRMGPWPDEMSAFIRDNRELAVFLEYKGGHMNTEGDGDHLQVKRRGFRVKATLPYLDLGFPSFQNYGK